MAVTNYYAVNGRLRGEDTSGTRLGYLTDALGSVTATIASDGVVQNTYRYKPYGQQLAKTGVGVDPKLQHAGDTGSRKTGLDYSEQYNQHRHLDTTTGRWSTVDLLWPMEPPFAYAASSPTTFVDPQGLQLGGGGTVAPPIEGPPSWLPWEQGPPIPTKGGGGLPQAPPGPFIGEPGMNLAAIGIGDILSRTWDYCTSFGEGRVTIKYRNEIMIVTETQKRKICEELAQEKNRVCPGNNKLGVIPKCVAPKQKPGSKYECDILKHRVMQNNTCIEARQAELDAKCLPILEIAGHKIEIEIVKGARENCLKLLREFCWRK